MYQEKFLQYYKWIQDYQYMDPGTSLNKARILAEGIGVEIFKKHEVKYDYNRLMLQKIIEMNGQKNIIPSQPLKWMNTIRDQGNFGSHYHHDERDAMAKEIKPVIAAVELLYDWFLEHYGETSLDELLDLTESTRMLDERPSACLYFLDEEDNRRGDPVDLIKDSNILGRSKLSDVVVSEDHISRKHAQIDYISGVFQLKDLNSTNHAYLNGSEIESDRHVTLACNDIIKLSKVAMEFVTMK